MARQTQGLFALNRGLVSRYGLARVDIKRLALAAETMTNWMPRVLGNMSLRVGLKYTGATYTTTAARQIPFVFATDDTARIEFTPSIMRVWINDTLLTRPSVATAVTNGTFPASVAGWTDDDEGSAVSDWEAPNYMRLVGSGSDRARRTQQVTVAAADLNVEHALRIVVARGPVTLRVGTSSGDDSYINEAVLQTGTHSLSFTPTGDFYIQFLSDAAQKVWVSNCTVEAAGVVTLPTPYSSIPLMDAIRYDQSGDIVFVACLGLQQRRITRRGTRPGARSWSIDLYPAENGPFKVQNVTRTTIACSATTGNITLTASKPLFKSTDVGGLYSVTSVGQQVTRTSSSSGDATNSIRVTGINTERVFSIDITGDATLSTVNLQRSYDNATWADSGLTWTANVSTTFDDTLDNQIVFYRLILFNRNAPDSVTMTLRIGSGSIRGIARVVGFTSVTVVDAEVLEDMGGTTASGTWQQGYWSDRNGWPSAVRLQEGRLWWAGINGIWGSVSDAYDSFDETVLGDSGTISRTIGSGPVDRINWLIGLQRLVIGAQGAEFSAKSSSLDEPLTPTNFNIKTCSGQGSNSADAVKVDQDGLFVNRSGMRLYQLAFDVKAYDYQAMDLTALVPDLFSPGIVRMAVQRQPDTRIHAVRSDGKAMVLVSDRVEDVRAWVTVETDGDIEDVCVLPALDGDSDDQVYYVVKRTIAGVQVRYIEKWAQEVDCRGDKQFCHLADSCITYDDAATTSIPVAHLEGEQVVVWADGFDVGTDDTYGQIYTVSGGVVELATAASVVTVGLPYTAQFKSAKLGESQGSPLNIQKRIDHVGLVMADTHPMGIRYGADFDYMDMRPQIQEGTDIGPGMSVAYDENLIEFPGTWTTDARMCLQAQAPRPVTVMAVTMAMVVNE